MKIIYTLIALFIPCVIWGQTFVYSKDMRMPSNLILTVRKGHIMSGNSQFWSDALLTTNQHSIYKGFSTSTFDLLYTLDDGGLYAGQSTFTFDRLYTLHQGRIYQGNSQMSMDCIYRYDPATQAIYQKDSTFPLDAILFLEGSTLTDSELFAVLLALEYL